MLNIVILAAGKGTRMRSAKPKVLHTLAGKPLVAHVIERARELDAGRVQLVIGHGAEQVETVFAGQGLDFVYQQQQLGTGHAVQQALPNIGEDDTVLILYGDVPLTRAATLRKLLAAVSAEGMGLLTVNLDDPSGYGRIVRDESGRVLAIVEQKDASDAQHAIREVNTGVMAMQGIDLQRWLARLHNNNAQSEYYLTDIIAMAVEDGMLVNTAQPESDLEVIGVNNRQQQAQLERAFQRSQAETLMADGLTLSDPQRFDCRGRLTIGQDCEVDINCIFEGEVTLGNSVRIGPNCVISDSQIADNCEIKANSVLENAKVDSDCVIGPFARLRPGTQLKRKAKIGNFVETKKARIGEGSKVNHLSYVGDAILGDDVNVGAGTITCNYDGTNKYQTTIGNGVFVGSNTALVAPVTIADGSTIGAGSTVTRDSQQDQLVIARARQRNLDGWKRPKKK